MPRTIWKGSISFGLVEIPVGVYSAEARDEIGFTMLDKRDLAPVCYKRYNKASGSEVPWNEIVKGYEHSPGEYVLMSDEDMKRASPRKTQTIDIAAFVDGAEIDPMFYETPYFLEPVKKDSKGYALLREALRRSGKVGIARVVLRTRQYLAALVARGDVMVLNTIRFAHELRDPGELAVPGNDLETLGVGKRELEMAERLVEGMTEAFEPDKYHDEYRDDLLAVIEEKVRTGQATQIAEPAEEGGTRTRGEVVDLMPLLRKSLEEHGRGARASSAGDDADSGEDAPTGAAAPRRAASSKTKASKKPARKKSASHGGTRRAGA